MDQVESAEHPSEKAWTNAWNKTLKAVAALSRIAVGKVIAVKKKKPCPYRRRRMKYRNMKAGRQDDTESWVGGYVGHNAHHGR